MRVTFITSRAVFVLLIPLLAMAVAGGAAAEPLPSWTDGSARDRLVAFVEQTTDENSDSYYPEPERIAVFDNDGCLWAERPAYFQLLYAIDRVKELAPQHPEWRDTQPFKAVLEGDMRAVAASGEEGVLRLVMASHAGLTTEEFAREVRDWLDTARHPKTGRPYTEMVYQPMLELLDYLRAHGFRTFIVSGGGIEFVRVFAEEIYGIPPEQVIGSSIKTEFEMTPDGPVIRRLPEIDFIDDKAGKPVGINAFIGRRPIAAFGNSDGDLQMLQWTTIGREPSLGVLIHHTDAEREWAYDRESHIGKLDQALDEAPTAGWLVVDMAKDWLAVFPAKGGD